MYDFTKTEQGGDKSRHIKILAVCTDCGKNNMVRKSWALKKIREQSMLYYCQVCNGKRNIIKARKVKMDNDLIDEFVWLCAEIFSNLYDDKAATWLAKKLDSKSVNLIEMARQFVADYLETGAPDDVIDCASYIESGADSTVIDLYDWFVQICAHALIHLESLPRPEGL